MERLTKGLSRSLTINKQKILEKMGKGGTAASDAELDSHVRELTSHVESSLSTAQDLVKTSKAFSSEEKDAIKHLRHLADVLQVAADQGKESRDSFPSESVKTCSDLSSFLDELSIKQEAFHRAVQEGFTGPLSLFSETSGKTVKELLAKHERNRLEHDSLVKGLETLKSSGKASLEKIQKLEGEIESCKSKLKRIEEALETSSQELASRMKMEFPKALNNLVAAFQLFFRQTGVLVEDHFENLGASSPSARIANTIKPQPSPPFKVEHLDGVSLRGAKPPNQHFSLEDPVDSAAEEHLDRTRSPQPRVTFAEQHHHIGEEFVSHPPPPPPPPAAAPPRISSVFDPPTNPFRASNGTSRPISDGPKELSPPSKTAGLVAGSGGGGVRSMIHNFEKK